MAPAFAMSTPLPVLYSDLNSQSRSSSEQPRSTSRLRSSFGQQSNGDSPSSTESLKLRSSFARKKSALSAGSSSSGGTSTTMSLRSSLESNGSNKPKDGRLAMMLQSKGHTSSAMRRRSTRSITSLPVTSKEEEKAIKEVKAKKNAQVMAKNQLAQQQKAAMKRQAEKGKTLDDFFNKSKLDDDSIDSDDDDMFSFLQWSAAGSEKSRSQSVGRGGRSRSVPRIRLSSRSVTSLLSESHAQARELRRSTSVPKTREDLEDSMSTLQTKTLSSLYGTGSNASNRGTAKRTNQMARSNKRTCSKEETKESLVTAPSSSSRKTSLKDDRLAGVSRKSREEKGRSSSRLRSIKQLREEEESKHKNGRRDSDKSRRHKNSRKSKDSDEKNSRRKSSRRSKEGAESDRGRKDRRKSQDDEEGRRRGKSRGRKSGDDSSHHPKQGKSRRRLKEDEAENHRSGRSRSNDGQRRRHRSKSRSRRHSGEERKSSHRSKSIRHRSGDNDTLNNSTDTSPNSRGSRSSLRSSRSSRHSEEKDQPMRRSMSLRRRSDSEALIRGTSQLLLVDEEVDHRAVSLSDCEDSNGDLKARTSYFSKLQTSSQPTPFQYPTTLAEPKKPETTKPPVQPLKSQPTLERNTFSSIRGMFNNLNLEDET